MVFSSTADGGHVIRNAGLLDGPGEGSIERARVDQREAEAAGELARGRRLAGRRPSVNGTTAGASGQLSAHTRPARN